MGKFYENPDTTEYIHNDMAYPIHDLADTNEYFNDIVPLRMVSHVIPVSERNT